MEKANNIGAKTANIARPNFIAKWLALMAGRESAHYDNQYYKKFKTLVILTFAAYSLLLIIHTLIRFYGFGYSTADFGTFYQILSEVGHGALWPTYSTSYPYIEGTPWIGFHFSLLIFIFAPLFALFGFAPESLCIFHVLSMTSTVFPIFLIMMRLGYKPSNAYLWVLVFLLNPITLNSTSFSIQENTLVTPLMAWGLWAVIAGNSRVFTLIMLLLFISKEHLGLSIAGFGLLWGWYNKNWRIGIAAIVFGLAAVILVPFYIMPKIMGSVFHPMFIDTTHSHTINMISRYAWMRLPWKESLHMFCKIISYKDNFLYALCLFLPFLFLPLFALPFILPALADLAANMLSQVGVPRAFQFYHSAAIIPVFTVAAAVAGKKLLSLDFFAKRPNDYQAHIPIACLILSLFLVPIICWKNIENTFEILHFRRMEWALGPKFDRVKEVIDNIPESSKIAVTRSAGYLFAYRKNLNFIWAQTTLIPESQDFMVFHLTKGEYFGINANYEDGEILESLLEKPNWGVFYWDSPWLIMKKNAPNSYDPAPIKKQLSYLALWDLMQGYAKINSTDTDENTASDK